MWEFFELLQIRWLVSWRNSVEFVKVIFKYYRNWGFCRVDLYLLRSYIARSPFTISKQYLIKEGAKEIYAYGETPLTTMEEIVSQCGITRQDVVYELGSGRGRTCFWLHYFVGCQVIGIETVPVFVKIAQAIKRRYGLKEISFQHQDMLKVDYHDATAVYFYGTCSDVEFILRLIEKFRKLPAGTKVMTVSYPLSQYTQDPPFELVKVFPAMFTWGIAQVYLQIKK